MTRISDYDHKSSIDNRYEEGNGTYKAARLDEAEASFGNSENSQNSNAIQNAEEKGASQPKGSWDNKTTTGGAELNKPKLQKAVGFAKKRGGIIGLISLFGIGGGLMAGFFGPASMLINLTENFSLSNDSSSSVMERRFAKIFGHMAGSDSTTLCGNNTKITCKMGRLSNKSLKQLSKKGVVALDANKDPIDFKKGKYPTKNPAYYDFGDNKRVPADQLRGFLANKDNRKYAVKLLGVRGAFQLQTKAWAGKYIKKKFYSKFKMDKAAGFASSLKEKSKNANEKLKDASSKLASKIPGVDSLKGAGDAIKKRVDEKTKKSKKGGVAYTIATVGCVGLKAPAFISAGVAGVQLLRLLPIVNELVLAPGSQLKASGVDKENALTPEAVDSIGSLLTNKTKDSDGNMTSALDSQYLQAAMGVNRNKPPVSEKFTPGFGVFNDPVMKELRAAGKASESSCNFILSPTGMFTFLIVESAITKTNPVGAVIGLAAGFVIGPLISELAGKILGMAGEAVINALADNDVLDNLQGRELGDAVGVSASAFFASGAMARSIPTLTQSQAVAFQDMKSENEQLQREMDVASLSPFDTSSRYTFMGSMAYSAQMAVLQNGGYTNGIISTIGSIFRIPNLILSPNASAATNFSQNYCGYAEDFELTTDDGNTPAINMAGLPCTGITNDQDAMSTEEAIGLLSEKGWLDLDKEVGDDDTIDELLSKGVIKEDTPLSAYVEGCSDASTGDYLFEASGCVVKPVTAGQTKTDGSWTTDEFCTEKLEGDETRDTCTKEEGFGEGNESSGDETRAYAAMAVFLIDYQLTQIINGDDDEEYTGGNQSGTVEDDGSWAKPLDSPKSLTTYDGHNGDDMATPVGSNVYAMRAGKVVTTETMSVEDIRKYCPVSTINGPQNNIMIESTVDGKTYVIRYAHLSEFKAKVGDVVKAGDLIALSGNTGCSTGPHLHIDITVDGKNAAIKPRDIIGTSF